MTDDSFKAGEKRGYSKGYAAGRKRQERDVDQARLLRHREAAERAFWERTYLALASTAMTAQDWKFGDKPITSGEDRAKLAAAWADMAVEERRKRYG